MSAELPHRMLARTLWLRALQYSQTLVPGDEIHLDIDGEHIDPFMHLLDAALARHGMRRVPHPLRGDTEWTIRRFDERREARS